ncbi:MAG: pitrilysin family protein, partial [Pseudomonadota bacterium]
IRAGIVSELKQLGENPDYLVSHKWKQTAFAGHNYKNPRRGDLQSIANIKKVDLSDFSQLFYSPCTPKTIAIVGDITKQEATDFLNKLYKSKAFAEECKPINSLPQAVIAESKSPIIVKKDIPQSVVHASLPGLPRSDKDYYALVVLNHIFGGSTLTSRLGKEIRDRNGLAYYANSYIGLLDAANWLAISFATRNEKTYAALDLMQKEFDKIATSGVTQEEFEQAKSYLTGSFPLGLDNQGSLAAYLINMQHEKLGINYLEKRNDLINAVTLPQVNELAKKIFSKKPLIVTVGDPKEIKP